VRALLATYVGEARGVFGICVCLGGAIIGFTIGRLADLPNAAGPAFLGVLIGVGLTIWLDNRFDQSLCGFGKHKMCVRSEPRMNSYPLPGPSQSVS
jgi:hypothetical protein